MLLLALIVGFTYLRGRETATRPEEEALSAEEAARLREILKE
jgi:cytochrome c-type biogenesis protein CcmH